MQPNIRDLAAGPLQSGRQPADLPPSRETLTSSSERKWGEGKRQQELRDLSKMWRIFRFIQEINRVQEKIKKLNLTNLFGQLRIGSHNFPIKIKFFRMLFKTFDLMKYIHDKCDRLKNNIFSPLSSTSISKGTANNFKIKYGNKF